MKDAILKILRETLPELEVEAITELHKEVVELREIRKKLEGQIEAEKQSYRYLSDEKYELSEKLKKHKEIDVRSGEVDQREYDVHKRELALSNELLKAQVVHLSDKVELAKHFYEIPFKNRQVRETVLAQEKVRHDLVPYTTEYQPNTGGNVTTYAGAAEIHENLEDTKKTTEKEEL